MSDKRRGLGRGLGALIPNGPAASPRPQHADAFGAVPPRPAGRPVDVFFDQREVPAEPERPADETPSAAREGRENDARDAQDDQRAAGDDAARDDDVAPLAAVQPDGLVAVPGARFAEVPVTSIMPNPRQPRTVFDEDELAELVHSVQEIGVLQPIVLRAAPPVAGEPETYELVMGERRWRAATEAGLATIPAIIRDTADDDLLRDALLENLHRSQLNPLEEAAAYQQLLEDFGCTHEDLAGRIGRSRPQISNTLRLLKLPPLVQRRVAAGVLSAGHARALLSLEDGGAMERLAQRIVAEGLSVRAVEEIIALGDADTAPRRRNPAQPQPEVEQRASALAERLDTRVRIAMGRTKGRLTVDFAGLDDLDRILRLLEQQPTHA
ncbi:ParB/RepB/Spo0J family partition protein [Kineococcus rubinsiae]|uniref:ParB/RepB/Spo0J family partition protein n=1 Tax=Kineococcus rubinsiae TaxID=2609562 RepID=UPI001430E891|nr:ParB/RepB/Spo0J family partition protein [Kineococcus rubinsiae]NIZ90692.1 ParB/RepB/Spo0J family partition protein [Kineococcus rubinsiae]